MATIIAPGNLSTAQTGNADSTNTIQRTDFTSPAWLVIANTAGATPTVTVNIKGSVDGTTWFNVPYALTSALSTFVVTAVTLTTTATNWYLLQGNVPYRFLKLVYSSNTNETITADYVG